MSRMAGKEKRKEKKKEKGTYLLHVKMVKLRIFRNDKDDRLYSAFVWLTF